MRRHQTKLYENIAIIIFVTMYIDLIWEVLVWFETGEVITRVNGI